MIFSKHWLLVFLLFPFLSYGQSEWKRVYLNENLSFTIPSEYRKIDTLGQENFFAKTGFANIQVVRIPQPQAQINNERELIGYYIAFQKIEIDQYYGDLVSDSTIKLNDLYARVFQFETLLNDSLEVHENRIVFIDNSMYSFNYSYFKNEEQLAKDDRNIFFSGINFHNTVFKDQLTIKRNKYREAGEFIGYIMRYVIIAVILLALIFFFLKKYQIVKSIVNIFSLGLLTWGAVSMFFYFVNLLMNNRLDSLLRAGVVCLIIGFVLRKVKLPLTK